MLVPNDSHGYLGGIRKPAGQSIRAVRCGAATSAVGLAANPNDDPHIPLGMCEPADQSSAGQSLPRYWPRSWATRLRALTCANSELPHSFALTPLRTLARHTADNDATTCGLRRSRTPPGTPDHAIDPDPRTGLLKTGAGPLPSCPGGQDDREKTRSVAGRRGARGHPTLGVQSPRERRRMVDPGFDSARVAATLGLWLLVRFGISWWTTPARPGPLGEPEGVFRVRADGAAASQHRGPSGSWSTSCRNIASMKVRDGWPVVRLPPSSQDRAFGPSASPILVRADAPSLPAKVKGKACCRCSFTRTSRSEPHRHGLATY